MKIKKWLLTAFAASVGISFMVAEIYAAKAEVDLTGRARGWFENSSGKKNKKAKSISGMTFKASARMGIMISKTEGDWTGSAKAELESHNDLSYDTGKGNVGYRDAWAKIENNAFSLTMGRQDHEGYCVTAYYPFAGGSDCIGYLLDRDQGLSVGVKGLPATIKFSFVARAGKNTLTKAENGNDVQGFNLRGSYTVAGATINGLFESKNIKGNKDRNAGKDIKVMAKGDDGKPTTTPVEGSAENEKNNSTLFGVLATYPIGQITVSGGFQMKDSTTNNGHKGGKDVKTNNTFIVLAGAYDLGNGMGVGGFFDMNTAKTDKKGDKAAVKQNITLGFEKKFSITALKAGFTQQTISSKDSTLQEDYPNGAESQKITVGLSTSF